MKNKKKHTKLVKIGKKFYKVYVSSNCKSPKEENIDEKEKIKQELIEYEKKDFIQNRINTNIYLSGMKKRFKYLIDQ